MDNKVIGNLALNNEVDYDQFYEKLIDNQLEQQVGSDINGYNQENYMDKFACRNDERADLYLQKMSRIEVKHRRYEESIQKKVSFLKSAIKDLERQLTSETNEYLNHKGFYESLLMDYFNAIPNELKDDKKTQVKYKLASGEIVMKKSKTDIKCADKKIALTDYALYNGYDKYVKEVQELDWEGLKKDLEIAEGGKIVNKTTGECVETDTIYVDKTPVKYEFRAK